MSTGRRSHGTLLTTALAAALTAVLALAGCGGPGPVDSPAGTPSRSAAGTAARSTTAADTPRPAQTASPPGPTTTGPTGGARPHAPATPVPPATRPAGQGGAAARPSAEPPRWQPRGRLGWQVQYAGTIDLGVPAQVYDLDWESTSAAQVARLRQRGVRTLCYLNAGAYESWRTDRASFPAPLLGRPLDGWPGERWLDVRRRAVLLPIMTRRMDVCRAKGFDAVDPDNMDGWSNGSGFPLQQADSAAYLHALAAAAHARGMSIGLKNALALIPQVATTVDFAVNEECVQYRECDRYAPLLRAGKSVFHVEYDQPLATVCARRSPGLSTIVKNETLDVWRQACP